MVTRFKKAAMTPQQFVEDAGQPPVMVATLDLRVLSLEELAEQFTSIQRQSYVLLGKILLEARSRFGADIDFGRWRAGNLQGVSGAQATRLMNLSRFFDPESRPLNNLPVSIGYLLSAPVNEAVAEEAYAKITQMEKPSLKEVRGLIAALSGQDKPPGARQAPAADEMVDGVMALVAKLPQDALEGLFARLRQEYTTYFGKAGKAPAGS